MQINIHLVTPFINNYYWSNIYCRSLDVTRLILIQLYLNSVRYLVQKHYPSYIYTISMLPFKTNTSKKNEKSAKKNILHNKRGGGGAKWRFRVYHNILFIINIHAKLHYYFFHRIIIFRQQHNYLYNNVIIFMHLHNHINA